MRVLVVDPAYSLDEVRGIVDGVAQVEAATAPWEGSDVVGLRTGPDFPVGEEELARLPAVKIVATCSVGYDHVDLGAAAERDIWVFNVPDYCVEEMADSSLALLLALLSGDEAGAELADRLTTLVNQAAQAHGGRPVKWLGDDVMFYFPEPSAAVLTSLDLVQQTPAAVDVRARVGINAGRVIFRDGDYFGRTVNVASRIADYARPGEVLVSDEVKESWDGEGVTFDEVGPVALKGLREEVTLYAASHA